MTPRSTSGPGRRPRRRSGGGTKKKSCVLILLALAATPVLVDVVWGLVAR